MGFVNMATKQTKVEFLLIIFFQFTGIQEVPAPCIAYIYIHIYYIQSAKILTNVAGINLRSSHDDVYVSSGVRVQYLLIIFQESPLWSHEMEMGNEVTSILSRMAAIVHFLPVAVRGRATHDSHYPLLSTVAPCYRLRLETVMTSPRPNASCLSVRLGFIQAEVSNLMVKHHGGHFCICLGV